MVSENADASIKIKVVRAAVESVSLYEITDHELEIFEEGSPTDVFLNFAILCLTMGVSFLVTLLTVSIDNIYIFSDFFVAMSIGWLGRGSSFLPLAEVTIKDKGLVQKGEGKVSYLYGGQCEHKRE